MKNRIKDIFIFGDSAFAEIAFELFSSDSEFNVKAFVVEDEYHTKNEMFKLPVYKYSELKELFNSEIYGFFCAITYNKMNTTRERVYKNLKSLGYTPVSYISSKACISKSSKIGEHCFIFEANNIQTQVEIGNNVVLWSLNHIGHHTKIEDNCFISSGVIISGFSTIKRNSFLGVNSSVSNNIKIESYNWIGPNVLISSNTSSKQIIQTPIKNNVISRVDTFKFFKLD